MFQLVNLAPHGWTVKDQTSGSPRTLAFAGHGWASGDAPPGTLGTIGAGAGLTLTVEAGTELKRLDLALDPAGHGAGRALPQTLQLPLDQFVLGFPWCLYDPGRQHKS